MLLYLSFEQPLVDSYPAISIPCSYLVAGYSVPESLKGSFMLVPRPILCLDDRKGSPKTGMMQRIATAEKSFRYACS